MIANELKKRNLPDVLAFKKGEKITTINEWEERKEELKSEFQSEMYGKMPNPPKSIRFEEVMDRKRWTILQPGKSCNS